MWLVGRRAKRRASKGAGWWLFGIHDGRWRATGSGACVRAEGVESVSQACA
jgi:hypothetical protein